jgi:hypothetical protein
VGWPYSVYQSVEGLCTQFETGSFTGAGCGQGLPEGDSAFGAVSAGRSGDPDGPFIVDGLVGEEVAEVVLQLDRGDRQPAVLMPLDAAGLVGSAFVAFAPSGTTVQSAIALDDAGDVLETMDLARP